MKQRQESDVKDTRHKLPQIVPWFNKYPNLPLGVECTMSMLHVRLCDGRTASTTYQERDLQLLYSTAVMRFLNHITVMSNFKDSMYKMAEQHQIPDWLINLRHQAAHGNSVPALYLLRQAGDIIIQWLRDNYWAVEAEAMTDVVKEPVGENENERRKITDLLQLWLVLKMHYWSGYKTIDNIPDKDIRQQAMELAQEEGYGIEVKPKKVSKKFKKTEESREEEVMVVDEKEISEYTHKIKTAFEPLLKRLFDPLKGKTHRRNKYQETLIDRLLHYEGFCPQIDLDQLEEREVLELMSLQGELWKELLEGLQSHRLLPHLLSALLSNEAQLMTAHLWLRLLIQLLSGKPPYQPSGSDSLSRLLAEKLPCDVDPKALLRKANFHHVKHQTPLQLKPPSFQELDALEKLARRVLENPTRFSNKYLNRLLEFWDKPLTAEVKEKLCEVARIYTGVQTSKTRPTHVSTVASLLDHGLVISPPEESPPLDTSPWKLYSGDADWSRCALGALPWPC